jgi:hypothetical protein
MAPLDFRTISKLDAAKEQIEAAIELFYAQRYVPAVTLAAAAEGCLRRTTDGTGAGDPPRPEPLFELMIKGAQEKFNKTRTEAVERFNRLIYWLKHETLHLSETQEVTNYDAWFMICRAITKMEAIEPGSETPSIGAFIEFSREHYVDFVKPKTADAQVPQINFQKFNE